MIEKHLKLRFGFSALNEGESPVKILTKADHGPGKDSLHTKMWFQFRPNQNGVGVLHHSRLNEFNNPQDMMDALIDFYVANYPELANATRG